MEKLADHPIADVFPLATDEELRSLAEDIQEHGQIEEIDIFEGKILDGRNRYRACLIAEVKPRTTTWQENGRSPLEYVVSKNLHRRHLTVAQRAVLGLKILPVLEEESRRRMAEGGKLAGRGRPKGMTNSSPPIERLRKTPLSRKQAADLVGVGETSIAATKLIAERSPKTLKKMERGELSVNAAAVEAGVATGTYTKKKKGTRKRVVGATPANNIHQAAFATGLAYNVRGVFSLIPKEQIPELISHAEHALMQWTAIMENLREEGKRKR